MMGADLHWPMVTWSPSLIRKQGDMWAGMFECLFSYLNDSQQDKKYRLVHSGGNQVGGILLKETRRKGSRTRTKVENIKKRKSLPLVFFDPVKVVPPNNNGSVHFCAVASSGQDTSSDRNSASEWAFLINVCSCKQNIQPWWKKQNFQGILKRSQQREKSTEEKRGIIFLLSKYHQLTIP